jgi:hypothetical protein
MDDEKMGWVTETDSNMDSMRNGVDSLDDC